MHQLAQYITEYNECYVTFSEPLIMKYPPGSSGHSFNSVRSRSVSPFSRQYVDLNMIGIFPEREI